MLGDEAGGIHDEHVVWSTPIASGGEQLVQALGVKPEEHSTVFLRVPPLNPPPGRPVASRRPAGRAVDGRFGWSPARWMYFAEPMSRLMRWAVLPVLPMAVCALVLAVIAWRRPAPVDGWDALLAFPASAVLTATAGMGAVALWWHGPIPGWFPVPAGVLGYLGGILIGVAIACTVAHGWLVRTVLAVPLGFFCLIISRTGPDLLAVVYATAVTAWWTYRTWVYFRWSRTYPGVGPGQGQPLNRNL